ncbi:transporter substrate-binding domain-containing protein [Enterovibrio makurazakiensis]|uniref:substrate-binding periplasmic protein n=1 Tax=Enterovibrio makurazakiensis TaxID=2910232 RepID=UPI003D22F462
MRFFSVGNVLPFLFFLIFNTELLAGDIAHIVDSKELEVCAHPEMPPFSLKGNQPKGFQIDISNALADQLDVSTSIAWIISKRHAKKTTCDLYAGVVKKVAERSKYMRVTEPFYHMEYFIVSNPSDSAISTLEDLTNRTVAVSSGSVASHALRQHSIGIATRFVDEQSRLEALILGEVDAAVVSNLSASWFQKRKGIKLATVDAENVLNVELNHGYALGLRRADELTLQRFNALIVSMKKDGTLDKLLAKYGQ